MAVAQGSVGEALVGLKHLFNKSGLKGLGAWVVSNNDSSPTSLNLKFDGEKLEVSIQNREFSQDIKLTLPEAKVLKGLIDQYLDFYQQ